MTGYLPFSRCVICGRGIDDGYKLCSMACLRECERRGISFAPKERKMKGKQ